MSKPKIKRPETIGRRLRAAREAAELTQDQLAALVGGGLTQSYIGRLERGEHLPALPMLGRLARALRLDLADLIAGAAT